MPLFEGQEVTQVVTPKDVRDLTGVQATDFHFESDDIQKELDNLLKEWITRIESHMETRLKRTFVKDDIEYHAIRDILIRTVAKVVAVAQQQRATPIVQISDFAVSILNTSEVIKDLRTELKPFLKRRVSVFSSLDNFEG